MKRMKKQWFPLEFQRNTTCSLKNHKNHYEFSRKKNKICNCLMKNVKNASSILFGKNTSENLSKIDEVTFLDVFNGVPTKDLSRNDFKNSESVESLLNQTSFFNSNSEIRRLVNQNSISINKIKIDSSFKLSQ